MQIRPPHPGFYKSSLQVLRHWPIDSVTKLQELLKKHYEIGERILDIQDDAMRRGFPEDDDEC
jgi:hypothetical protein